MRTAGSALLWVLTAITGVLVLAFVVGIIATQDTPNALGWAIFCGCLVAAPLFGLAARSVRSSRPCPRCGKGVKKGVVVCPTCGFDFSVLVSGGGATAPGRNAPDPAPLAPSEAVHLQGQPPWVPPDALEGPVRFIPAIAVRPVAADEFDHADFRDLVWELIQGDEGLMAEDVEVRLGYFYGDAWPPDWNWVQFFLDQGGQALLDAVSDAIVAWGGRWLGKKRKIDPKAKPIKAQIFGPDGEVLREVEVSEPLDQERFGEGDEA